MSFYSRYINLNDSPGVTSVNTLAGALTLAAGANVVLTPSGNTITISASSTNGANQTLSNLTSPTAVNQPLNIINTTADSPVHKEMIQLSRTGGNAGAGAPTRSSVITFHDADNPTYTASIDGQRLNANNDYLGVLQFSVNIDGQAAALTDLSPVFSIRSSNLVPTSWASGVPAIVLDGTIASAVSSGASGLLLNGNGDTVSLLLNTADSASSSATPAIYTATGANTDIGNSGGAFTQTGNVVSGNSGQVQLFTGDSSAGSSGDVILKTGAGAVTRGHITMDALFMLAPKAAADPSTTVDGATYYNTSSHVYKYYNGTTWKTIATV